jgi:hypothetical protein
MTVRVSAMMMCAALLVPAVVSGQASVVATQLEAASEMFAAEGFSQEGTTRTGALAVNESQRVVVNLVGGREYVIVGVCDGDCTDLDLVLYHGAEDEVISEDFEPDDVPMVTASPTESGRYHVEVLMAGCSVAPCGFGVAVFSVRAVRERSRQARLQS